MLCFILRVGFDVAGIRRLVLKGLHPLFYGSDVDDATSGPRYSGRHPRRRVLKGCHLLSQLTQARHVPWHATVSVHEPAQSPIQPL